VLTALALIAFAWNSIFTRMALAGGHLDAVSFTAVRLTSGALVLVAIVGLRARGWSPLRGGGRLSALALFGYAAPFTFAYLRIGAAVGALVLFGTVQLTMIGWGIAHGERPGLRVWAGLALAAGGLAALMLPAAHRPDLLGLALMVLAGICWGAYSLMGKTGTDPLAANARAFLWNVPMALVLAAAASPAAHLSVRGLVLAALSGGVTSALGYAIWYRALRGLSATQAAVVQLSVPVIAALAAILVLDERMTLRLIISATTVIGGVALALTSRRMTATRRS
jgi:drug/metabolite transporter (DMT)-like permease